MVKFANHPERNADSIVLTRARHALHASASALAWSIVELLMDGKQPGQTLLLLGPFNGRQILILYSLCWSNTQLVLVPTKHNGYINYVQAAARMTRDGIEMIGGKK